MTDLEKLAETLAPIPGEMAKLTVRVGDVESQIVQLRTEMRGEFSAVRGEIGDVRQDIANLTRETAGHVTELGAGLSRLGVEMRTLFEANIDRRKVIAEGNPPPDAPPSST